MCNNKIKILVISMLLSSIFSIGVTEGKDSGTVKFLSFHAHKYQDFEIGSVVCEVFGEMENLEQKEIKAVRVEVDLLDEKNKVVYSEELQLQPRVIVFGNPGGIERSLKPSEIGIFSHKIKECPKEWLEGKIKYRFLEGITGE